MAEYGYIPESPDQKPFSNKGIFTAKDIYDLTNQDKWTTIGQLELIETITITSSTNDALFDSIKEDIYRVHFLTWSCQPNTDTNQLVGRMYESGVEETASVYQVANYYNTSGGTNDDGGRSTGINYLYYDNYWGGTVTNERHNGYAYFYNLGDSTRYSFMTAHRATTGYNSTNFVTGFSSSVLPQKSVVDGFNIGYGGNNVNNGTFSLYGIKEYS
tara:strand:- start:174 stop:818 length:645 start_codon:yes stop_codon:yes gene_type:complete